MLKIEEKRGGTIHIVADGLLTSEEYAAFVPEFERLATVPNGPVSMLIELGPSFAGWTLGGLWRELAFDIEHREQFGRIAVLGDARWEKWGSEASNLLFDAEIRFFERSQRLEAERWLCEPAGVTGP